MNKFNKIFLATLLLLPFSCYEPEEEELKRTEVGNDVFDIKTDAGLFTEGNTYAPSSLVIENGKVCFSLHGDLSGRNKSWDRKRDHYTLSITFPLDSMKIERFSDVVALDEFSLDFAEDSALVVWKQDFHVDTLDVKSGLLKFSRARLIGIDGERNSVILAGDISLLYDVERDRDGNNIHHNDGHSYGNWSNDSIFRKRMDGWFDVVIKRSNFENRK